MTLRATLLPNISPRTFCLRLGWRCWPGVGNAARLRRQRPRGLRARRPTPDCARRWRRARRFFASRSPLFAPVRAKRRLRFSRQEFHRRSAGRGWCCISARSRSDSTRFLQFVRQKRAHAGTRRAEHGRDERGRRTAFIEHGNERFADAELGQQLLGFVERCLRIILRHKVDRFAILRGEGAQGVLHFHPELPEDRVWNVGRQLRAEENADAFRADELDHRFDFGRGATSRRRRKSGGASSIKRTSFGFSRSPTSGSVA